jgi:putative GTP pyrophosphokinase
VTGAIAFSQDEMDLIERIVAKYKSSEHAKAARLAEAIFSLVSGDSAAKLLPFVHSFRMRAKDPDHLRDKLQRKLAKAKNATTDFDITEENLFEKINDLAGLRILHLHTAQFPMINEELLRLLKEEEYEVLEGPVARTWDDEYRSIFAGYGVATESNPRMYTSVHYVVGAGRRTAEIQVRTLAEELWGEVDHTINYPHPSSVVACQEQIKVLARVTSGCTRLVDSIFLSNKGAVPQ